jgi:hypothetical protein
VERLPTGLSTIDRIRAAVYDFFERDCSIITRASQLEDKLNRLHQRALQRELEQQLIKKTARLNKKLAEAHTRRRDQFIRVGEIPELPFNAEHLRTIGRITRIYNKLISPVSKVVTKKELIHTTSDLLDVEKVLDTYLEWLRKFDVEPEQDIPITSTQALSPSDLRANLPTAPPLNFSCLPDLSRLPSSPYPPSTPQSTTLEKQ